MMKKQITLLFLIVPCLIFGQPGGKAFQFLDQTNSAKVASLGGKAVAVYDDDLNMPYFNPSLLNPAMDNHLVLNYVDFFAGINYGYASYAKTYNNLGTFAAGIHYLNYGNFTAADETGLKTGSFRAADYSLNLMYSRNIDSLISVGITIKSIYSDLETYSSFALAADAGITYYNPEKLFTASLAIRNIGRQITTYYKDGKREPLPFDITIGISQDLRYAPFKFYLLADHLEKFDLTFKTEKQKQEEVDPFSGEVKKENKFDSGFDKVMRHFIFGTELSLSKNLHFRVGYNYRRRQEMKIDSRAATVGLSWGVGFKISKFHLSYARSAWHVAGSPNYFSLSMNLNEFYKKF
jgi:hypothetical protein